MIPPVQPPLFLETVRSFPIEPSARSSSSSSSSFSLSSYIPSLQMPREEYVPCENWDAFCAEFSETPNFFSTMLKLRSYDSHLQSLFSNLKLGTQIGLETLLELHLFTILKKMLPFLPEKEGQILWEGVAEMIFRRAIGIRIDGGRTNFEQAPISHREYAAELTQISQQIEESLQQHFQPPPSAHAALKMSKSAKKRQQQLYREQKYQEIAIPLWEQWSLSQAILMEFLKDEEVETCLLAPTFLQQIPGSSQLQVQDSEETARALQSLQQYVDMQLAIQEVLDKKKRISYGVSSVFIKPEAVVPGLERAVEAMRLGEASQALNHCREIFSHLNEIQKNIAEAKDEKRIVFKQCREKQDRILRNLETCQNPFSHRAPIRLLMQRSGVDTIAAVIDKLTEENQEVGLEFQAACQEWHALDILSAWGDSYKEIFESNLFRGLPLDTKYAHVRRIQMLLEYYLKDSPAKRPGPTERALQRIFASNRDYLGTISELHLIKWLITRFQIENRDLSFTLYKELLTLAKQGSAKLKDPINLDIPFPREIDVLIHVYVLIHDMHVILHQEDGGLLQELRDEDIFPPPFLSLFFCAQEKEESSTLGPLEQPHFSECKEIPPLVLSLSAVPLPKQEEKQGESKLESVSSPTQVSKSAISEEEESLLDGLLRERKLQKVQRILRKLGLELERHGHGSHTVWTDPSQRFGQTVIPRHQEIALGTLRSIRKQILAPISTA